MCFPPLFPAIDIFTPLPPLQSVDTEFRGGEKKKKKMFSGMMMAFGTLLCGFMRTLPLCVCVRLYNTRACVQPGICVCVYSPFMDATTHPLQPENTLIFPTLRVKGKLERTEVVCVFVGVCVCVCALREKEEGGE